MQVNNDHTVESPDGTPLAGWLAPLWCELLEVEQVLPSDDFFELGGHSIVAMRMVARIRAELKLRVPVRTLFEAPVFSAFVERMERQVDQGDPGPSD
jgi:aryl carrier-like protein